MKADVTKELIASASKKFVGILMFRSDKSIRIGLLASGR